MAAEALESMPLPQLREQIRQERHANELLRVEVEMLEKRCRKMELCSPLLPSKTHDAAQQQMQACGRYRSKLHSMTDSFVGLTLEQKYELVEQEVAEVKDEIRRMKEDSEKTMKNLQAKSEEADIWWADIKKARSEFENIVSTISSKTVASEKLLRYMEEKNHQRDLLREKLRLKNCMLRGYKKKLEEQIREKKKMRGTVSEACLQEMQVRNAQLQKKCDEKRQELQQLQLTSRKMAQVLDLHRKKLQDAMETSVSLKKTISRRKQLLEKIEKEIAVVEEQRAKAEAVKRRLWKQLSEHSAPSVLSYLQVNMAVADLKAQVKAWERKVAFCQDVLAKPLQSRESEQDDQC